MDILIGFAVAALKAGVLGVVGDGIEQALVDQGIDLGSDQLKRYLEKVKRGLGQVLTDKSLKEMDVLDDQTAYIREEIKELLRSVSLDEDLFRNCHYDAKSLAEALYKKYAEQKKDFVEYKSEIQKVLYVMSEKAISLEKERDGFTADSLAHIINNQEEQMELIRKIWDILNECMKNGMIYQDKAQKQEQNKRLPDRTEEYCKKWTENMFLNDFDEDDEEAGVNIPLCELYQLPFYRLKGQNKDLENLEKRLDRCTQGKDLKNRMLLILGQPGMGKSTMITWFVNRYQEREDADKKEMLVYRFTDLDIEWSFNSVGVEKHEERIDSVILKCLNMEIQDLNGKILILDGFDEVAVGNNRMEILSCLYNAWARDTRIKDFSLLVTCRENYIEDLSQLLFPYITLQPWNEGQIDNFCRNYGEYVYGEQAELQIPEEAIEKMKKMRNIFGIPLLLYMTLALEITVKEESSVVEVYDQIFNLEKGGLYDRCLKRKTLFSYDRAHRIVDIKKQIHQFSREISMWMFEHHPEQAAIPQNEYEKIRNKIFEKNDNVEKLRKKDVLIGNYFRIVHCYDGVDAEKLSFVHRSIYEYFVAETIFSEIREAVVEMTEEAQERLAGVLGYRLKKGKIDYTIGQYFKAKVSTLTAAYSEEEKNNFYIWLEGAVGKMLNRGMLYYTEKNIKEYSNVIEKELTCFLNVLDVLRLFLDFSSRQYILQDVNQSQVMRYICCLISLKRQDQFESIDLDLGRMVLCETDLRDMDLSGVDLKGVDLSRADLRGVNLRKADLSEANLNGTNLSGANLSTAKLRMAYLRRADLRQADLNEADLREADLREADLREADLREADLSRANLIGVKLNEADLRKTNFSEVDFIGVDLGLSRWDQEDIDKYIESIMQADFYIIYICSEKTEKPFTHKKLLARYHRRDYPNSN